ncbi:endochitinase A1-like [Cryptomeria japonica]|uniref:endochitinase A1-like n=1 Tax=Cryptomeria japonica TaxID=3369 RepID=UPI0027DA28F9|nr:endochitinase A1-like [Cryptomeria japonica]
MANRGFEFPVSVTAADTPTPLPGVTATYAPGTPFIATAGYAPTPFSGATAAYAPAPSFPGNSTYAPTPLFGGTTAYPPTALFDAPTVCPPTQFFAIPSQSSALDVDLSFRTPGIAFTPPTPSKSHVGNPPTSSATQSSSVLQPSNAFCTVASSSSTTSPHTITIPLPGEGTALAQTTTSAAVTVPTSGMSFSSGPTSTANSAAYPRFTLSSSEASATRTACSVTANTRECGRAMEKIYAAMVEMDELYERLARAEFVRGVALIERDQAQAERNSLQIQPDQVRERERQMQIEVQQLCAKIDGLKQEQDRMQQLCAKTRENVSLREAQGRAEGHPEGFVLL